MQFSMSCFSIGKGAASACCLACTSPLLLFGSRFFYYVADRVFDAEHLTDADSIFSFASYKAN